jgi:hypothetical protein
MPYRRRRAADFGPLLLEAARGEMISPDFSQRKMNETAVLA